MITIQQSATSHKAQFNYDNFVFGIQPTDHIFLCEYQSGEWLSPRIVPYHNLTISPLAMCLHYGQTVFEGMKAFRQKNGRVIIFRPEKHYERLSRSLERMCMPQIEQSMFMDALQTLIQMEQHWIPDDKDISLYIRPFIIATEPRIGIKVSQEYLFGIVCTPMGLYYPEPVSVKVETQYVRAAEGGVGYAKCGGNYGAAFYPTLQAQKQGFEQVIWTDAQTHECIEEAGTMNIMIVMENKLITPCLSSTILDGVTRDSILQIGRDMGLQVEERKIKYSEIIQAFQEDKHLEIFGAGTAAVISPVKCIHIEGTDYSPYIAKDAQMYALKQQLENIRKGIAPDLYHWNYAI